MMNYEFLRQLSKPAEKEELSGMIHLLREQNIEIYRKENNGFNVISEEESVEKSDEEIENGCLFVSAADLEAARQILIKGKMQKLLLMEETPASETELTQKRTPAEEAEAEYLRKRKINRIECLVVLAAAVLYYLWKM